VSRNIPEREEKVLIANSGGMCAFPGCRKRLTVDATATDDAVFLGEMAHIVGDSHQGPRGRDAMSDEDRDKASNLILFCRDHHKLIDTRLTRFSVGVLRQMKLDHERWVARQTGSIAIPTAPPEDMRTETIHSTLLPITHLPAVVFVAPCAFASVRTTWSGSGSSTRTTANWSASSWLKTNCGRSTTARPHGPSLWVIDPRTAESHESRGLWGDADGCRRYVGLLNKAMFQAR